VSSPIKTVANPEPWRYMVRHVVSTMLGHVGHKKVVSLVLSNPSCSSGVDTWAHLKHMLAELIQTFRYEERVLESSIQVLEKERILLMRELVLNKRRALHSHGRRCSICFLTLSTRMRSVVYTCGHAAHVDCADRCGGISLDSTGTEVWSCTLCHPAARQPHSQDKQPAQQHQRSTRVTVTGKEANTQQLDEDLKQALAAWQLTNQTVDYTELDKYERDEGFEGRGYFESDKFKLQLRPAGASNTSTDA
jgi:hypothetical protein